MCKSRIYKERGWPPPPPPLRIPNAVTVIYGITVIYYGIIVKAPCHMFTHDRKTQYPLFNLDLYILYANNIIWRSC